MGAALLAGERLSAERGTQRSILSDELERRRYEADLARRRFDNSGVATFSEQSGYESRRSDLKVWKY